MRHEQGRVHHEQGRVHCEQGCVHHKQGCVSRTGLRTSVGGRVVAVRVVDGFKHAGSCAPRTGSCRWRSVLCALFLLCDGFRALQPRLCMLFWRTRIWAEVVLHAGGRVSVCPRRGPDATVCEVRYAENAVHTTARVFGWVGAGCDPAGSFFEAVAGVDEIVGITTLQAWTRS